MCIIITIHLYDIKVNGSFVSGLRDLKWKISRKQAASSIRIFIRIKFAGIDILELLAATGKLGLESFYDEMLYGYIV